MASLLLTTAILNLKSLAEEKLFLYLSRGATAHCSLSLQTLNSIAHLAIVVCSASGATPPRDVLNLRHNSAMSSRFFLPVSDAFLLSVWSSACKCLCPVCYNHAWSSSSMWAPILMGIGLWPVCMDITAFFPVLFFFSYFLSLSLSVSLSGLSHLMMSEQGKSFHFFFVSVTDHSGALSLLHFWAGLCITKATKLIECQ